MAYLLAIKRLDGDYVFMNNTLKGVVYSRDEAAIFNLREIKEMARNVTVPENWKVILKRDSGQLEIISTLAEAHKLRERESEQGVSPFSFAFN